MRLTEFDMIDRSSFKLKFGSTIEDSILDLDSRYDALSNDYNVFVASTKGKDILKSTAGDILKIIYDVYDFCNECNNDQETQDYLDRLIDLNNKITQLVDSIK